MSHHKSAAAWVFLVVLLGIGIEIAPILQNAVRPYFSAPGRLDQLRLLLVTIGGAMVGGGAIAFSIVIFAMQVNIERMPHGLFRKLSSDALLLSSFASVFFLAIALAGLSVVSDTSFVADVILAGIFVILLILFVFIYALRRALRLINPLQQLRLVVKMAQRDLRVWGRRALRAAPLLESTENNPTQATLLPQPSYDMPRMAYFAANTGWTAGAHRGILYAISLARRYAEIGDYEVSSAALGAVVRINAAYVSSKGKTFVPNRLLIDSPLSTDRFINDTLEQLRQNVRLGLSRQDEPQIEQTLGAIALLIRTYLRIDYSDAHAPKSHAQLAATYLSSAVQSIASHDMVDVLMEGIRLMGSSAQSFLVTAESIEIVTLAEKIALIGCTGAAKIDYRPVTLSAMEQLAKLTFDVIRAHGSDIRFTLGELKRNVLLVATLFLSVPDAPLANVPSSYLAPYYSGTSTQALQSWLTNLANAVLERQVDDRAAQATIRNVEDWADGLYSDQKELLLKAIERRSHFVFDIIHWIAHVTEILLVFSSAPACDEHTRDKLREHASSLVAALSWVPDEREVVAFVENFGLTEVLFDVATDALRLDCDEVLKLGRNLLISWGFKGGRHGTGWAILERSLYGLAALAIARNSDEEISGLKRAISERLTRENAPDQMIRDRAGRNIREFAATLYSNRYALSHIEFALTQVDQGISRSLLVEIANLLSPDTANDPVRLPYV